MTPQKVIEVSPRQTGFWAVKVAGAARTVSVQATRVYAIRKALRLARSIADAGGDVVLVRLRNACGMIEEEPTYGAAPAASTGAS